MKSMADKNTTCSSFNTQRPIRYELLDSLSLHLHPDKQTIIKQLQKLKKWFFNFDYYGGRVCQMKNLKEY